MNGSLIALIFALGFLRAEEAGGKDAPVKKLPPAERKRKFEAMRKELEAFRPAADAPQDEVLTYLEQVISTCGKFARENPQTAEGFEAASSAALQLAAKQHPKSIELAQLALDVAPQAGVERKQVAICWVLVASGKMQKGDAAAAREALEKMKDMDEEIYTQAMKQFLIIQSEQNAKAPAPEK
jgi:ABC-type nitrate/sulfonate/bicarbonate transport system substrate-binding protein